MASGAIRAVDDHLHVPPWHAGGSVTFQNLAVNAGFEQPGGGLARQGQA